MAWRCVLKAKMEKGKMENGEEEPRGRGPSRDSGQAIPAPTKARDKREKLAVGGAGGGGGGVVAFEEGGEFFEEEFPGGFIGEENVIGAGKGNELCAGNYGGEDTAFFGRSDAIAVGVENNGRNGDFRKKLADVDVVTGAHGLDEIFGGDGDDLEILEPALVFIAGFFGDVEIGDDLEERWIGLTPVELDESFESATDFDGVGTAAMVRAARIGPA